jgi:hypothetical protein
VTEDESRVQQVREVTVDLKDSERLLHQVEHLRQIVLWAEELKLMLPIEETKERERF